MAVQVARGGDRAQRARELVAEAFRHGEIAEVAYREPFGQLFVVPGFEQGGMERETGFDAPSTNQPVQFSYRFGSEASWPRLKTVRGRKWPLPLLCSGSER